MTADDDDRSLNLLRCPQQLDLDLLAGVHAFGKARQNDQAVGAHERHDHPGPALERRRDGLATDHAEVHAQELIVAHWRQHLAAHTHGATWAGCWWYAQQS